MAFDESQARDAYGKWTAGVPTQSLTRRMCNRQQPIGASRMANSPSARPAMRSRLGMSKDAMSRDMDMANQNGYYHYQAEKEHEMAVVAHEKARAAQSEVANSTKGAAQAEATSRAVYHSQQVHAHTQSASFHNQRSGAWS
jgi:hypothetical protein